jgi:flagellar hook-associated protein FlgK
MSSLSIGLSGLLVNQRMIDLAGQNITNADTPGYHLQVGNLAARVYGGVGDGVEIQSITRLLDQSLENAIVTNTSSQNQTSTKLDGLNQLQTYLAPGPGSVQDALTNFFNAAIQLSANPDDVTQRRVFLGTASELADRLNATSQNITQLRSSLIDQAHHLADQVNTLTGQIARLNQKIHDILIVGGTANELQDQRDDAINQLSQLVDVRTVPQDFGVTNVLAGGTPLVLSSTAMSVDADIDGKNQLYFHLKNSSESLDINGGKIAGILELTNKSVADIQSQFDNFAAALVTQIDQIQATGIGLNGPLTSLTSQRLVTSSVVPLASAGLKYPPKAGDLYVTVTNLATGQRTLSKLSVNPATQSLTNIAAAIDAIPNLQAVVDPQAGTLNLVAAAGYGFDFTGNFSSTPDAQTLTGTAAPTFSGTYTGTKNDTLNFKVVGTGTVGASSGLSLEVRNGAGTLLTNINIGQGYEAGTDAPNILGVKLNLSNGTVTNGDTFSINVAANADTGGLLPSLGMHSFFVGNGAAALHVNQNLLDHPENLALSKSGQPGDGSNLTQLVNLQDKLVLGNGQQTFQQYLQSTIGDVASQVQDTQTRKSAFDALDTQLQNQRQSASGVDPNEELMRLVQFQRAYQASAYYINVSNQSFNSMLQMLSSIG